MAKGLTDAQIRELNDRDQAIVCITSQQEKEFWENVDVIDDLDSCWPWLGTTKNGYGVFPVGGIDGFYEEWCLTHRISYFIQEAYIDSELVVCHLCDNPPCVRPSHLVLGTPAENTRQMFERRRDRFSRDKRVLWAEALYIKHMINRTIATIEGERKRIMYARSISQVRLSENLLLSRKRDPYKEFRDRSLESILHSLKRELRRYRERIYYYSEGVDQRIREYLENPE